MPSCSVIGCGRKKSKNHPSLTLHRLPTHEQKKKKWLEALGVHNISRIVKDHYICSFHFNEDCFNRTLDVMRLRDDAVPNKYQSPNTAKNTAATVTDKHHLSTVLAGHDYLGASNSTRDPLAVDLTGRHSPPAVPRTPRITPKRVTVRQKTAVTHGASALVPNSAPVPASDPVPTSAPVPVPASARVPASAPVPVPTSAAVPDVASALRNLRNQRNTIKKLQEQCITYRKTIKQLRSQIRRRNKKMETYKKVIHALMERNIGHNKYIKLVKARSDGTRTRNIELPIEQRNQMASQALGSGVKKKKILIRKKKVKSTAHTESAHNRKLFTFLYEE